MGGVAVSVEGHVRGVGHGGHADVRGVWPGLGGRVARDRLVLEHRHALPLVQVLHCNTYHNINIISR